MAATPHNSKGCSAVNTGNGLSCFENSASVNVEWRNVTERRSRAGNHEHILHLFTSPDIFSDLLAFRFVTGFYGPKHALFYLW